MIVNIVCVAFGVIGFAYGVKCYHELWKWARQCQNVKVAIQYKGKVKMQPPLVELLLWANQLDRDKDANGRVFYGMGGTHIAIIKGWGKKNLTMRAMFRDAIKAALPKRKTQAPMREGKYKTRADKPTPPVREVTRGAK